MNVFRISHPHGSPEGENSTYVFPNRSVIIDPGPPGERPWRRLCDGLSGHGLSVSDVRHIIVTHWHADHAGLAPRLASTADATLHMHELDAPLVREYTSERTQRVERDKVTLERWGVPKTIRKKVSENDTPSPMPDRTPVTGHTDGDTIAGLTLRRTAGHTPGHLAVQAESTLYVGDTLLPMYTPNVGGSDTRTDGESPLETYLDTLDDISSWDVDQHARPGHGAVVSLPERIETTRLHHWERVRRAVESIPEDGHFTPWDVARVLFGEMSGIHVKMGAGEAAAHLEYAASRDFVERVGSNPHSYRVTDLAVDAEEFGDRD
ncbi:MBL fold metallo-hydrolase [Haloferax sp. YSMS24]|uniref:MBL fold metallo-hydrolase n=1 Tax=unclassified Haloferax TaxID=2625095 RepID=UPI00398CAEB3